MKPVALVGALVLAAAPLTAGPVPRASQSTPPSPAPVSASPRPAAAAQTAVPRAGAPPVTTGAVASDAAPSGAGLSGAAPSGATLSGAAAAGTAPSSAAASTGNQTPQASLPPAATGPVEFARDIAPILSASCVRCHGRGRAKGGFSLESREALLRGGDSGEAITPGQSADSYLVALVAALDPDEVMPKKGSRLTAAQVGLLRAWIDRGAPWDPGVSFARTEPRNLDPRQPALQAPQTPRAAATAHPVDRLLAPYFASHAAAARVASAPSSSASAPAPTPTSAPARTPTPAHKSPADPGSASRARRSTPITSAAAAAAAPAPTPPLSDRAFARRLYFDLLGLPPTPAELRTFLADRGAGKRDRLIASLLADRVRYAEHWLSFWNDLLRNDYRGPGFIDGGREQISPWLYNALRTNLPYDQLVSQLVNPAAGSGATGFTKGIVWRGVVNASQTPPMQAAQNISQVLMGVNLKCASCHDSFINDWQLADAYGLASVYADAPLEMVECDRPTGRRAPMKFLYPTLGTIDAAAPRAERLRQLSALLTAPRNGRLPRTIVNRLWARLMGRGLVEPVDDMDQPAWSPELLDWLAEDLVAHGYDLQHTITRIVSSRAYQRPAVELPDSSEPFVFRGPAVRRLSAEQFVDAIGKVTGVWQAKPERGLKLAVSHADVTTPVAPALTSDAAATPDTAVPPSIVVTPSAVATPEALATPTYTRAALVAANPLMIALGRPTREQVVTTRATAATTLQALEMLNGGTLADLLRRGAANLLVDRPDATLLVSRLYERALARAPTAAELSLAREQLGPSPGPEEVEDLLWAVVMLPEFQLLY